MFQIRATTKRDIAAVDALLARAYPRLLKGDYPPSTLVMAVPLISRAQSRCWPVGPTMWWRRMASCLERAVGL
jgi:hypothetical protein